MSRILVTRPGALNQRDRAALRKAGVVCVEADDPAQVKLIEASGAELGGSDILFAAMSAIARDGYSGNTQEAFAKTMVKLMEEARAAISKATPQTGEENG